MTLRNELPNNSRIQLHVGSHPTSRQRKKISLEIMAMLTFILVLFLLPWQAMSENGLNCQEFRRTQYFSVENLSNENNIWDNSSGKIGNMIPTEVPLAIISTSLFWVILSRECSETVASALLLWKTMARCIKSPVPYKCDKRLQLPWLPWKFFVVSGIKPKDFVLICGIIRNSFFLGLINFEVISNHTHKICPAGRFSSKYFFNWLHSRIQKLIMLNPKITTRETRLILNNPLVVCFVLVSFAIWPR